MAVLHGYAGKILHVDLTTGSLSIEEPPEDLYRTYMGGSALGLYYLLKNTPAGADPYGPENTLAFMLAGITGAPIAGQSRATVVAKSPLTGGVGDSQAGGFWPAELKFAGFDGIVIRGISPKPVYLWIDRGEVELRDAGHLWGKTTNQVDEMLVEELGDKRIQVTQVGPAGEKLVRFAAILNMATRAHGRTGMGAVMGSKKLKAIVVRGGKKKLPMADPDRVREIMQPSIAAVRGDEDVWSLAKYGTLGILESQNAVGGLPTRNYQSGWMGYDRAASIGGERLFDDLLRGADEGNQLKLGRETCYSCAVRCKRVIEAEWEGRAIDPKSGGTEYETGSVFGSYCDIDDIRAIAYANQLCNQYGVDTIAAGATMAFAINCFEQGLITADDTDGIELGWGDADAMIAMLEKTLNREGFGDVLAEGSARAGARIGNGAEDLVVAVKGTELPAHMPQVKPSLAVIYAVNPFGADHQSSEHDPSYTPELIAASPDKYGKRSSMKPRSSTRSIRSMPTRRSTPPMPASSSSDRPGSSSAWRISRASSARCMARKRPLWISSRSVPGASICCVRSTPGRASPVNRTPFRSGCSNRSRVARATERPSTANSSVRPSRRTTRRRDGTR
jgi:aldehyde:ferredoxin oxidoreductase